MRKGVLILTTLVLFACAVSLKQMGVDFLGAAPPPVSNWVVTTKTIAVGVMYYILTILGIAAGVVYDALGDLTPQTPVTRIHILSYLHTARSWRGLVVSPLIFLTVYMGVRSNPVAVPFILLAFQNGFFWKATMTRIAQ